MVAACFTEAGRRVPIVPHADLHIDQRIELGQGLVVKYVQDLLRSKDVDPAPMLSIWYRGKNRRQWILSILYGHEKFRLRIMERDILGWPWSRSVLSGRYERGFRSLVDHVRAA
jgi:hypothetical protein